MFVMISVSPGISIIEEKAIRMNRPPARFGLQRFNVLGLQTFRSFGHVKLDLLSFLQAAEAACLNGREMHENIFARLTVDEAETFGIVKPLHCSLFHVLLFSFLNSRSGDALSIPERLFAPMHASCRKDRFSPDWKQHTLIEVQFSKVQKIPPAALNDSNYSVLLL